MPETLSYDPEDIAKIIHIFFQLDDSPFLKFLDKVAFPFRIMRISISLYNINTVSDPQISTVRITEAERSNSELAQLIWSQFLVGTAPVKSRTT